MNADFWESEADDSAETAVLAQLELDAPRVEAAQARELTPDDPRHSADYQETSQWLGVPFTEVDFFNAVTVGAFLRRKASEFADKGKHQEAAGFQQMADRLTRTRKKIQARIAHRAGQ